MADTPARETYDGADPAAENNAKRDAARWAREDADVFRGIMHTKPGRAWLYRFLDRCHINNTPFFGEDTHNTAHALGRESVGKEVLAVAMAASVDLYMKMIKEQQEEEVRLDDVRRKEQKEREEAEAPPKAEDMVGVKLPPPAGYPGHVPPSPLPKKK